MNPPPRLVVRVYDSGVRLAVAVLTLGALSSGCGLLLDDPERAVGDSAAPDVDGGILDSGPGPFVPLYSLVAGVDPCPTGFVDAGFAEACEGAERTCEPLSTSILITPTVSPWQELRGRVRGLQGQSSDAFFPSATSLDEVYVDGVSITTEPPRRHLWTFAAGLMKSSRPDNRNCCPCDNGAAPPSLVGDSWTCETGNDEVVDVYDNMAPTYTTDVLWDADGDAHGAGCAPASEWFVARLDEPTTARVEVRLMRDSCDDRVVITELELEIR